MTIAKMWALKGKAIGVDPTKRQNQMSITARVHFLQHMVLVVVETVNIGLMLLMKPIKTSSLCMPKYPQTRRGLQLHLIHEESVAKTCPYRFRGY